MASKVVPQIIGVDVGKKELWLSVDGAVPERCPNRQPAIRRWLKVLAGPAEFALEATNNYHLTLALEPAAAEPAGQAWAQNPPQAPSRRHPVCRRRHPALHRAGRGRFKTSDAFIAFLGMDVRVRDSGGYRGRRKLTKAGDPELRVACAET